MAFPCFGPLTYSNTLTLLLIIIIYALDYSGLKYEDLLLENDDMEKALHRIPKNVKTER